MWASKIFSQYLSYIIYHFFDQYLPTYQWVVMKYLWFDCLYISVKFPIIDDY